MKLRRNNGGLLKTFQYTTRIIGCLCGGCDFFVSCDSVVPLKAGLKSSLPPYPAFRYRSMPGLFSYVPAGTLPHRQREIVLPELSIVIGKQMDSPSASQVQHLSQRLRTGLTSFARAPTPTRAKAARVGAPVLRAELSSSNHILHS